LNKKASFAICKISEKSLGTEVAKKKIKYFKKFEFLKILIKKNIIILIFKIKKKCSEQESQFRHL
jgi:hypothetical protein